MTAATRKEALSLYRKIFRIARKWQSATGIKEETAKEKQYIVDEARTLFYKNKNRQSQHCSHIFKHIYDRAPTTLRTVTNIEMITQCIDECKARVEMGLHYGIPYPRPIHLPPMGLAIPHSKVLSTQVKLRKQAKPIYLKSHDEVS